MTRGSFLRRLYLYLFTITYKDVYTCLYEMIIKHYASMKLLRVIYKTKTS